jgi:pimeloyl-ACP methyl ester carboxylesterase
LFAALVVGALVTAACSTEPDVAVERSDRLDGETGDVGGEAGGDVSGQTGETADAGGDSPVTSLDWSGCEPFAIPSPDELGTNGWECTTLTVAMDPFGDSAALEPVQLALTRHRATGERRGTLLMNPGGPGGSGLEIVWGLRGDLPVDMLRSFDIVSWDPRGVGFSVPAIRCGPDPDPDDEFLMTACADATGDLASFLAAPYSAADMESIRIALGESRLDYLGYSYGAVLGASYAAAHPDTVGRFVLDGVTDPLIGSRDGPFEDGFPYYAEDGVEAASRRFEELCDLTDRCALEPSAAVALDELGDTVDRLPTDDFEFEPQIVSGDAFTELMVSSFAFVGDWELLATALEDARGGDASALASLTATDPGISSEALGEPPGSSELANLVIYCADFAPVITEWSYCDGIPRNEFPLAPVTPVDVAESMLVIGTAFDPATPGKHAPDFAAAIGDAVHMIWDGVGHTAFPAPSRCVNDTVSDYLLDGVLPADGLHCAFLDGITDDASIADDLFGHGGLESERLLRDVVAFRGVRGDVGDCVARALNESDDQVISHIVLGVTSERAEAAIDAAIDGC